MYLSNISVGLSELFQLLTSSQFLFSALNTHLQLAYFLWPHHWVNFASVIFAVCILIFVYVTTTSTSYLFRGHSGKEWLRKRYLKYSY